MWCLWYNQPIMLSGKKVVAFDLDGTLAGSKLPLMPEMARLLCGLASKVKVIIISGGSFSQFKNQVLPGLVAAAPKSGGILGNIILMPTCGSQCFDYGETSGGWELSYLEPFPEKLKIRVLAALNEVISSGRHDIPEKVYGDHIEDRQTQITLSALGQRAPIEEKAIWDPDSLKRQKIKEELELKVPEVQILIGGTTSVDILPKGFDKATGLKKFLKKVDLQISDMLFVGDAVFPGGNDYSPLEAGIESIKISDPEETARLIESWF